MNAKINLFCGAAAALLSTVVAIAPVNAQVAPPAPPPSPAPAPTHYKHGQQRADYNAMRADVSNDWAGTRVKQHAETERFHDQDAKLRAEDQAYRAAHGGKLGKGIAERIDSERVADKDKELTNQHRATYKAQFNDNRAHRRYSADKVRMSDKH